MPFSTVILNKEAPIPSGWMSRGRYLVDWEYRSDLTGQLLVAGTITMWASHEEDAKEAAQNWLPNAFGFTWPEYLKIIDVQAQNWA